jgi:ankyrin repeat protein
MGPKKKAGKKKSKKDSAPVVKYVPPVVLPTIVSSKTSTLLFSVISGNKVEVNRLVKHYHFEDNLGDIDVNGSNVIHLSIKKNDIEMVKQLITTILGIDKFRIPKNILDNREKRVIGGYAPIHIACLNGFYDILLILIKGGSNLNIKADSTLGETPLHVACKVGNAQCAKILIDSGAKADLRDNFGHNASFWAQQRGHDHLIKELGLPSPQAASAAEYVALLLAKNPKFVLPGADKGKGKKKKGDKGKKIK